MEHNLVLLFIGLLLNVFHNFGAELNVIPRDTEVMVNDSTYMNCSTSLQAEKVQWYHGNKIVYTGRDILQPYNVRFSVEVNSSAGTSNLIIRSVQPSDAGKYECLEDEGLGEKRSAQLIVLDDDPICTSILPSSGVIGPNTCDIEPDVVKLSCSMTYHGNISPILQWKGSGDNQSIIDGRFNFTSNKNEVFYTLTMKSTLDLNNSSFICQTTRTFNRNYSCSSDVINILYIFSSNVTINLTMNDEVRCFANTSQSCTYKWKWFSGSDSITVSNDQTLKPTRVGSHRCEATCSLGNKLCTVEAMYAEVYSTLAASGQNLLALLILFALPVIVLISVVTCHRWRKNQIRRKSERKPEEVQQPLIATLPEKYKSDPVLFRTFKTKAAEEGKKTKGLTILNKELFTVSEKCSKVEVYDSIEFRFSRRCNLKELINPFDIESCDRNKCLYISDYKVDGQSSEILKVDSSGKLIKNWSTGGDYGRLSVTDESSVILAVFEKNKLHEYSPDGVSIREINLLSDPERPICHPLHAIKLTNGYFVVSHGYNVDDLHRVCLVDGDGKLEKSFGGKCGSTIEQMDLPIYLAVDGNGFVMVADRWNTRVLLLDSDLVFKKEILSKEKFRLRSLQRILLDQTNGRLFVADDGWDDRSILIFKFTK